MGKRPGQRSKRMRRGAVAEVGQETVSDSVRLAALRALGRVTAQESPVPVVDEGLTGAVLAKLRAGMDDAEEISIALDVPIDPVIPVLWRIGQSL